MLQEDELNLKVDVVLDLLYKMLHLADYQLTLQQSRIQFCVHVIHSHQQISIIHSQTGTVLEPKFRGPGSRAVMEPRHTKKHI